jgi:histidine triad (HIT) family protein
MTLSGTYDSDNVFALIIKGDAPSYRVFEDHLALAFLDIFPQAEGHTLVVPKETGYRTLLELPTDKVGPLMERVHHVAHLIADALNADGIEIQQLNGDAAGQTVYHLHFHVIPRTNGLPLIPHGEAPRADDARLRLIANQIRNHQLKP